MVIPWYGEASGVPETLVRLREALASLTEEGGYEIIVVDDGSPVDVAAAALEAGADQAIRFPANRGKGAAVRAGVLAAKGRTVAFTDADLAYSPEQLLRLLAVMEAGADMVVGSRRHMDTTDLLRQRRLREVSGQVFSILTAALLLRGRVRDTQCGLKAFRADVASVLFTRCRLDGFAFDVEVLYLCERYGLRVREVPVEVTNSDVSSVHVAVDAVRMVRDLLTIRRRAAGRASDLTAEERRRLAPAGRGRHTA